MFPHLFKALDPRMFQCDVCVMSKHHRVSYPINNKLSSKPFSLIHSNIWRPSKIRNCSGTQWFVSFIDDCTCMCWVFLLKEKAAISTILPYFCKMVSTQFGTSIQKFRIDNGLF